MSALIIGNWKSNGSKETNKLWFTDFFKHIKDDAESFSAICPPYVYLNQIIDLCSKSNIKIGAQDIDFSQGARTGSISAKACKDLGCNFSIIGHSERREFFKEDNFDIRKKLICAQENDLKIVMCIGEPIEIYDSGSTKEFLKKQLTDSIDGLNLFNDFIIAYEPIWAIGSGKLPSSEEINAIHFYIKDIVQSASKNNFTPKVIYGGSVSSKNAEDLFKEDHIDGALIGGASLDGKEFANIANIYVNRGH